MSTEEERINQRLSKARRPGFNILTRNLREGERIRVIMESYGNLAAALGWNRALRLPAKQSLLKQAIDYIIYATQTVY